MWKKGEKYLHNIKKDIRFNEWQIEMIERAVHVKGLRCGDFPPLAVFIRGAAVAKAHAEIRRYNRIKKAERDKIEAEYESECEAN